MKKCLLTLLVILFACFVNAQDYSFPKNNDGEYEFTEVVNTNQMKSILFSNATAWAIDFYEEHGYKNVVQLESEVDGRMIIKDYDVVLDGYSLKKEKPLETVKVYYTLTIDCKDNKYRYIINDIAIKSPSNSSAFGGLFGLEWDMTHETHLEEIKKCEQQIDSINGLTQNAKGKKLKKLQAQIEDLNEKIKSEKDMYKEEFLIFDRLIKTLKKKMATNSNF